MGFVSKFKQKAEVESLQQTETDGVLSTDDSGSELIVYLSGKIDVTSSEKAKEAILSAMTKKPVVLDIEKVTYLSSAGMRMFFEVKKACDMEGTTMEVRNIKPNIYKILRMAGYSAVLNLKTLEE